MDKYQELSIFVCGSDHADKQALCEDYSAFRKDDDFSVIAVSSGGNESQYFRSYLGARFAVEAALDSLTAFASSVSKDKLFADKRTQTRLMRQLEGSIVVSWNEKVNRHLENYPFQQEELDSVESDKHRQGYQEGVHLEYAYWANVTAAVATDNYCLIIRGGNGECVLIEKDGKVTDPLPVTRKEDSYALCRPNAAREFSYCCSDSVPSSIFLVTEGVRRCFPKQEDYHAYLLELTQMLLRNPNDGKEYLKADLPALSRKGSHDDMCLAAIWSSEKLGEGPAVLWKTDVEWERDAEWKRAVWSKSEAERKRKEEEEERKRREEEEQERQKALKLAEKLIDAARQEAHEAAAKASIAAQQAVDEKSNVFPESDIDAKQAVEKAAQEAMTAAAAASAEATTAYTVTDTASVEAARKAAVDACKAAQEALDKAQRIVREAAEKENQRIEAQKAEEARKKKQAALFKKMAAGAAAIALAAFLFGGKGDSDGDHRAATTEAESSLEDKVETENQPETRNKEKESRGRTELEESIRESIRQESVLAASIKESLEEESRQESLAEESRQESLAEESRQAALAEESNSQESETEPPETTAPPKTKSAPRQTTAAPPQTTAHPQTAPPETAPPETAPPETNPPQPETPPAPPPTQPETSAPAGQEERDIYSDLLP